MERGYRIGMREAILYERLDGKKIKCKLCQYGCVIGPGRKGHCWARINEEGKLSATTYGQVSCLRVAPMEVKPLFHFYPGTYALTFGSWGCNFRCPGCQNWDIAHRELAEGRAEFIGPEEAVRLVRRSGSQGICWSYNEPTIWFEYTLEGARLAKEQGFHTSYVTNGYITKEALDLIGPYLDAFRVDIKAFSGSSYKRIANIARFEGILESTSYAKNRWGMHVEVVTNLTPGINDDEGELRALAKWVLKELGQETPWHVTRFIPHLKLSYLPPTPVKRLERAIEIGRAEGLKFVYIGNVPGHPWEHTYCPGCSRLVIRRGDYRVLEHFVESGKCKFCGTDLHIKGEVTLSRRLLFE
ncbi:MAG: AmmeMemoRadiSam system radical SAM enzyme [candidate division NC10 bacterium]|nr:AmmeMemoRadiSam system radical SAM enzyme [candidate division NC10 bacterium]